MRLINGSAARVPVRRTSLVRAAMIAALFVPVSAATASAAGSISGHITDSVTHTGLAGARAEFYDLNANSNFPFATATADGSGNYSQNLPDGTYGVLTQNSQGYINKIWNNISCSVTCDVNSITPVVVSGGAVAGIDFALDSGGGRISGTITSSTTGNPIAGALVYFISGDQQVPFSTATTDAAGHYTSEGGTGTGNVYVLTRNGQAFQDEGYNNHKCSFAGCHGVAMDPVAVTLGETTSNINFALDPGGQISGTVKDANNSPLAHVDVRVYDATGAGSDEETTDATGNFITSGLAAGTYYVATRNSVGLVDYAWNTFVCPRDLCDERQGTPISVAVGSTTSGINFVLTPGQTISGTVTAAAGGAPLADEFVSLMDSTGAFLGGANTDASGNFTTGAVPPGTYYADAFVNGYVNQLYNHVSCPNGCPPNPAGTPIVVANQPVTNINFALLATGTGSISGTVTDAVDSSHPTGVQVQLLTPSGQFVTSTTTTTGGVYTFLNVAAGSYYVRTNVGLLPNGTAYINQLYNGVTCVNCSVATTGGGTLVTVTNGGAANNINFTLQHGGVITGTITKASDGTALANIGAQIFNSAGISVGTFNTNASGVFISIGLPAGSYYVRTANIQGYINQQWQNLACPQAGCVSTAGTPVAVNGNTVSGINFALAVGGHITGNVTDASNSQVLQNVAVAVFTSAGVNLGTVNTDASGNYATSGLPTGTYFLRTQTGPLFVNNQTLAFVDQLYSGTQCVPSCLNPTAGTPVAVTSGATASNVNFALSRGGFISGGVVDAATGVGLSAAVQIYTASGALAKAAGTNSAGGYIVAGLPAGTYYARTSVPGGIFYQDKLYNDLPCSSGCSVTNGTPITVLAGATSNGVDFALTSGAGGISGTITDKKTGALLPGVFVEIYNSSGVFTKSVITGLGGTYATSGLAPGTYYARTVQYVPTGHADQLYTGARCTPGCTVTNGTPIVVTAGAMTSGIDFALGSLLTNGDFLKTDFDGDGKTDIAVWRGSTGGWFVVNSSNGAVAARTWGAGYAPFNDVPVHGDYDGDGKTDVAIWRPSTGTWFVVNSKTGTVTARAWGTADDIPVPGDYDGDGKTDFAIWRPSTGTWFVINSSTGTLTARTWGAADDIPVPADYDGDGKTDFAVWRPSTGTWFVINSSNGSVTARSWGAGSAPYNDVPVPGDYDGDGKTDFAIWRPSTGTWFVLNSKTGTVTARTWGAGYAPYNDVPVPGDYDGDGKTDFAIWRASTGTWFVINSKTGTVTSKAWGAAGLNDVPVPSSGVK